MNFSVLVVEYIVYLCNLFKYSRFIVHIIVNWVYIYVPIPENPTFSSTNITAVITTFGDNPDDLSKRIECYIRVGYKHISISAPPNAFDKVEA